MKEHKVSKVIATSVIQEYAVMELMEGEFHPEVKLRADRSMKAARHLQNFFLNHAEADNEIRETMKRELLDGKFVLISELVSLCLPLDEEGIEEIIKAVKMAITPEP